MIQGVSVEKNGLNRPLGAIDNKDISSLPKSGAPEEHMSKIFARA